MPYNILAFTIIWPRDALNNGENDFWRLSLQRYAVYLLYVVLKQERRLNNIPTKAAHGSSAPGFINERKVDHLTIILEVGLSRQV